MNQGALLFTAWLNATGRTLLAASFDLRIAVQSLTTYERGESKPGRANALKLRAMAKIPIDAWDQDGDEPTEPS